MGSLWVAVNSLNWLGTYGLLKVEGYVNQSWNWFFKCCFWWCTSKAVSFYHTYYSFACFLLMKKDNLIETAAFIILEIFRRYIDSLVILFRNALYWRQLYPSNDIALTRKSRTPFILNSNQIASVVKH